MASIATPGKDPGTLQIPSLGRTIKLVEWREDSFYDTVQSPLAPTAGQSLEVFRDLTNKNLQHTNLRTSRRIPAGSEFICYRISVIPAQAIGNIVTLDADILKLCYAATLTFKLNDRLIQEGPLYKFQGGFGVTGSTTRNATGVVTIGVPSAAAAPMLMVAQPVADDDDLVATVDFRAFTWATTGGLPTFTSGTDGPLVTVDARGFIKKPQGK